MVDPNDFLGDGINRNIPVQNEELNINVRLTALRKGRTIIIADSGDVTGDVKSKKNLSVSFFDGSEINGKKVLTTKFTDLTTVFELESNNETLGITNIDIDFDASLAPKVTIDFVDVRGSSIFQNEGDILKDDTENPYSVFFDFPYPLFELEVKGYYGYPVKYCLHMVKFNSKFNSQTGNFEIKAEFIGYTYAMLSDMLIGVLRVITNTKLGGEFFADYNKSKTLKTLSIPELRMKIGDISKSLEKASQNSENSKILKTFTEAKNNIENIESIINSFPSSFDEDVARKSEVTNFIIRLANTPLSDDDKKLFNEKNQEIKTLVDTINNFKIGGINLVYDDLKVGSPITDLTKKIIDPNGEEPISQFTDKAKLTTFKKNLTTELSDNNIDFSNNTLFTVFDLRSQLIEIRKQKQIIERSLKDTNKLLAIEVKDIIARDLGIEPNIRNIIEIFTAAIETFMYTLYKVSETANDNNTERRSELEKVFKADPKSNDYVDKETYFPWPSYFEKANESQSYTEKYLGASTLLESPEKIPEVKFIEELLAAFIKTLAQEKEMDNLSSDNVSIYLPTNVLDTPLFFTNEGESIYTNPYLNKDINDLDAVKRLIVLRAMAFLGYTNDEQYLTMGEGGEVQEMAKNEAISIVNNLKNEKIKQSVKFLNVDEIKKVNGSVNDSNRPLIQNSDGRYYYNYIVKDDNNGVKLLPIGYDIHKSKINITSNQTQRETDMIALAESGKNFVTNYSSCIAGSGLSIDNYKYYDGGAYVKILTLDDYNKITGTLESNVKTESIIVLDKLKANELTEAGFNSFGGKYGIQDFTNIQFGEDAVGQIDAMYLFYGEYDRNGLGITRTQTKEKNSSASDLKKTGNITVPTKISPFTKNLDKGIYGSSTEHILHNQIGKNRNLSLDIDNTGKISYPYIEQNTVISEGVVTSFSLFGSKWYYLQAEAKCKLSNGREKNVEKYAKALLFLNTIPVNICRVTPGYFGGANIESYDPFYLPEVRHLFDIKGGFVHVPRLWAAYVGGVMWWMSKEDPTFRDNNIANEIIGGGRGVNDPIVWKKTCGDNNDKWVPPQDGNYFPKALLFPRKIENNSLLITLPRQVKDEFKKVFFDFVNATSGGFDDLKNSLEIYEGSPTTFCGIVDKFLNTGANNYLTELDGGGFVFNANKIYSNFKNYGNYSIITPIKPDKEILKQIFIPGLLDAGKDDWGYGLFLELKDDSNAVKKLLKAFSEELVIANTGYNIWKLPNENPYCSTGGATSPIRQGISVSSTILDEYINTLVTEIKEKSKDGLVTEEEKILNEQFGTSNKTDIKGILYRHCQKIYNKWLAGVTDANNIIFQCGENSNKLSNRYTVDKAISKKYNNTEPRLIDSFRFVTRSFKDIGDILYINPKPIGDKIASSPNINAYNMISDIFVSNKFTFHALPSFINFNNDQMLRDMFTPFPDYNEVTKSCGPSFVSVYVGQLSNHLDFKGGKYPNDGFDLACDSTGNLSKSVPEDFKQDLKTITVDGVEQTYEDPVSVFNVRYSQQNQNFFKDITLDQSEFSETEESLKIISEIADKNGDTEPTFGGQNMYNVYAVRSYTAEIEMMGNAMVQPLMFFQLDNIPMFHGAYMITRVRHSIQPNYMSTIFTGSRIRAVETPIFDVADAYANLIDILKMDENIGTSKDAVASGTFAPIIMTIKENGGVNGNPFSGNIAKGTLNINNIKGLKFALDPDNQMISVAIPPLELMTNDFITWMKSEGFKGTNGTYLTITSMFRSIERQKQTKADNGSKAATPGKSPHGWGIAVDFQFLDKEGNIVPNKLNADYFKFDKNPAIKWLYDNSYKYGFYLPYELRNSSGLDEHWHWEYHGTSAECLWKENPTVYDYKVTNIDKTKIKPVVSNPKNASGKEAVYTSCKFTVVNDRDGDFGLLSTKISNTEYKQNQVVVKNKLKANGLTKVQASGVMGNIQQESGFNPTSLNKRDLNGYPSYGLIQWNFRYYNKDKDVIGTTVDSQINYLLTMPDYSKFKKDSESNKSSELSAFRFAKLVERCDKCVSTYSVYSSSYQNKRSRYASDFFIRFNDPKDELYW